MPTVLITGANRGLGLEFATQYARDGWRVHACCRAPGKARDLAKLAAASGGAIVVHAVDVGDPASVAALAKALSGEAIDVLVNNAGVYGGDSQSFGKVDGGTWDETLRINALGPLLVTQAFAGHLAKGSQRAVLCVSSKMGSIADNTSGGSYVYRASKAALNAVVKSLALDLGKRGITVVVVHPGWVKTDMGGRGAPLDAPTSIAGLRKVVAGLKPADAGRFVNYDGTPLPW